MENAISDINLNFKKWLDVQICMNCVHHGCLQVSAFTYFEIHSSYLIDPPFASVMV